MSRVSIVTMTAAVLAVASAGVLAGQQDDEDQVRARQRISMMEGVLERAVSNGADNLLRQVRTVMPDSPRLTGNPEVRGFRLEDYGIFFDVEVPGLSLPVTWPLRQIQIVQPSRDLQAAMTQLRVLMAQIDGVDTQTREGFAQVLSRLERAQMMPVTVNRSVSASRLAPGLLSAGQSQVIADMVDDPQQGYTREIRTSLIDAMLENSGPLELGPDEFLTVAARDNMPGIPLIPGDATDFSTLILRVRGSDLAAFRGGRLTIEEARERVDVREY
jgi:hypothetical protein